MAMPSNTTDMATKMTAWATFFTAVAADGVTFTDQTLSGEVQRLWNIVFDVLDPLQQTISQRQTQAGQSVTAQVGRT